MRLTRLFAPLALATTLLTPAVVPAANAADGRMAYTVARVFAPTHTIIRKTDALVLTNVSSARHTFKVTKVTSGVSSLPQTINNLENATFTLWQSEGVGEYVIYANGDQIREGVIEVIE